jgi:hypothetical protein
MVVAFDPSINNFGVAYLIENKLHLLTFDLLGAIDWIRENYKLFNGVVIEDVLGGGAYVRKSPKETIERYGGRCQDIGKLKASQIIFEKELQKLGIQYKRVPSKVRQRAVDRYKKRKPINRLKLHQYLTKTNKEQFEQLLSYTDIELVQARKGAVKLGSEHARDAATLIIFERMR